MSGGVMEPSANACTASGDIARRSGVFRPGSAREQRGPAGQPERAWIALPFGMDAISSPVFCMSQRPLRATD
jgi:hypothetical protein